MNRIGISILLVISAMMCPGCLGLSFGGKNTYVQPDDLQTHMKLEEFETRLQALEQDRAREIVATPGETIMNPEPGFSHTP